MGVDFGSGSVMILDEAQGWTKLGAVEVSGLADPFGSDLPVGESPLDAGWSYYDYTQAMSGIVESFTVTFEAANMASAAMRLWFGGPIHPVKGHPHTGKKYRQECRRYDRELKAWRKRWR